MTEEARVPASRVSWRRWFPHMGGAAAILAAATVGGGTPGCGSHADNRANGGSSSGGGASSGGGDDGGTRIVTGADGGQETITCTGGDVVAAKRIVRLTYNQIVSSIGALIDSTIETKLVLDYQLPDAQHRTFPPLTNPREGSVITSSVLTITDEMAQDAAQYVHDNFATVTKCATATDACAQAWLKTFWQGAYRRPLSTQEQSDLMAIYTADEMNGGVVAEATQFGVYAALDSPWFLYRTELGTDTGSATASAMAGPLAPYELASALSYFLTDAPPDTQLLGSAADGSISKSSTVRSQISRIITTPAAQANLEAAMFAYFGIPTIETVVIDSTKFPAWNPGLQNSMRHETELFLHDRLWTGVLGDLLTSSQSRINQSLATLYGITQFPQAGSTPDSNGFALTTLPSNRSGLITQSGFLVARARPDKPSVVSRGLLVNQTFICASNPPFPTDPSVVAKVNAQASDPSMTERQKADFRAQNAPCNTCHPNFDPYGLTLQNYDVLGTWTTTDVNGNAIAAADTQTTLPQQAGGELVANGIDMAHALTVGGAFMNCMAANVMSYAMAENVNIAPQSCSTIDVTTPATKDNGSFTSLITEIAASQTLASRNGGM